MIPIRLGAYGERRKPLAGEGTSGKLVIFAVAAFFHVGVVALWWIQRGTVADGPEVLYHVRFFDIATFPSAVSAPAVTLEDSVSSAVLIPMAEETSFPELTTPGAR